MIKMKVKELLLWRKGGSRLVAGSSGFWEMGAYMFVSLLQSRFQNGYTLMILILHLNVKKSWIPCSTSLFIVVNYWKHVLGIAMVYRSRAHHENTVIESYKKRLCLMTRLRQLDIDLRHLVFEVPVYIVWQRCDPHEDPCQVLYICGFHTVAQNQRLRMCVKSLLDGRQQPQWLSPIL